MTGAPIHLTPQFMMASTGGAILEKLWDELPWVRIDTTPRRECWMNDHGIDYAYGSGGFSRNYRASEWHPILKSIQGLLRPFTGGATLEGCFTNGYEDGHDHLGWHSDDSPEIDANKPIAIISIGAEREIWFRPIGSKDAADVEKVSLPSGSLLVMEPGMQQTHQHRIPKASFSPCPPRVSLTYRGLVAPRASVI